MLARHVCIALAVALQTGCYSPEQPACGFACGASGSCPADYECHAADNRCHLVGTDTACAPALVDAGFTDSVEDRTPPQILDVTPLPNASNLPVTTPITAHFSEFVRIDDSSFQLATGGVRVLGIVTFEMDQNFTAEFVHADLLNDTVYTATITTDVIDLAGNAIASESAWQFATGPDVLPPVMTDLQPMGNATNVPVGTIVSVSFNEDVIGVSDTSFSLRVGATPVAGTVTYGGSPVAARFTPTSPLAPSTVYTVELTTAIEDTHGNPFTGATWMFTTAP